MIRPGKAENDDDHDVPTVKASLWDGKGSTKRLSSSLFQPFGACRGCLNSGNSPEVSGHLPFYARQIPIPQEASGLLRFCLMSAWKNNQDHHQGPILSSCIPRKAFPWSSVGGEQMEVSEGQSLLKPGGDGVGGGLDLSPWRGHFWICWEGGGHSDIREGRPVS